MVAYLDPNRKVEPAGHIPVCQVGHGALSYIGPHNGKDYFRCEICGNMGRQEVAKLYLCSWCKLPHETYEQADSCCKDILSK